MSNEGRLKSSDFCSLNPDFDRRVSDHDVVEPADKLYLMKFKPKRSGNSGTEAKTMTQIGLGAARPVEADKLKSDWPINN
jgi:hypothetical protein